jgi:3-demethoxyubiquinol 3-hydroxylase
MFPRDLSALDKLLVEAERALATAFGAEPVAQRPSPAAATTKVELTESDRRHAAGLMRINHAGEVCAQALYFGQAALARDDTTRAQFLEAAAEETDHLAWCAQRLDELHSRTSYFNPLWYAGSFAIGSLAALVGDKVSLGFVVETERQVEAHLGEHLQELPNADVPSRVIVAQMQRDEAEHGQRAKDAGAVELPAPLPTLMRMAAGLMKAVAYRL